MENATKQTVVLNRPKINAKTSALAVLMVLAAFFPFFAGPYWLDVGFLAVFYIVLGLGLNVVVGYAGLLDLGYSAFFAVGAYTTGIFMTQFHMNFFLALALSGIFAAVAGLIIGAPTLRLRSDYLAIVTLGFGEIVKISAKNLEFTGGASGIYGILSPFPAPTTFMGVTINNLTYCYWAILILVVLAIVASKRLGQSRIGRSWAYIREDEDAAEAMGINRVRSKLAAYSVGAFFGGLAGAVFAVKMTAIAPESFNFMQSVMILLAVILGGLGRISGVVIGAIIVIVLPESLRDLNKLIQLDVDIDRYRFLVFGVALVILMIFRPQGLVPESRGKE
ncbi:ABC transporter permease subunit [Paenibacillus elgii]|uniref:ABC transporter permease subunit n=1 Tax=Paenibacillus elgii TaxID=189691 RepID=UPI000FDAB594|nr:branched-chain amino acid ABC transporter permease [Paenibacillus elgii]NEN81781.1 branched-chain amino acid ABC transporter permease [Paenibacillus elgii]